jgi:hypothetical protein
MVGWDGIEPPTQDFQTGPHPPARTNDLPPPITIRNFAGASTPHGGHLVHQFAIDT